MSDQCQICGVNLSRQDNPLERLVSWPPMLLPGDIPTADELCRQCLVKIGRE